MENSEILIYKNKVKKVFKSHKNEFLKLYTTERKGVICSISLSFEHDGIDPYEVIVIILNFQHNIVTSYYFEGGTSLFKNITFENFDYCIEQLTNFLENYYNNFEKFNLDDDFDNVPIIGINNWINYFCEHLEENPNLIWKFAEQVYDSRIFTKYKPIFEQKIGYLINANKFDLI
jgi:hypothetical protein